MPLPEHLEPEGAPGLSDYDLAPTQSAEASESATTLIGRYLLIRRIGEGGMGEVWLAEQREPVRRRVALKLIRGGLNTREALVRFDSERQALAMMDHPAIARVFDADATPQGAPYFVMEYVAGIPITDYCDKHRLSTRERLELFTQVCEGVQHAHQKAIIHRDLKPSNILVTEVDGRAVPKIIDFGVAKALTQRLTPDTMFTVAGGMVGTPGYMSPEQARSSGEDIDTRSDVYSLGIVFYELLAGVPPVEARKVPLEEFLRRLREDDPPKPSTKISTQDVTTSTDVAHKRQTDPQALARQLRGELDSIALKALEKERSRRYPSASEFAADVRRYLNNEPVLAVPPSLAYRARKFTRRYRVAIGTAAAFALVLIVASIISIQQSIRANREAAASQRVADFMVRMFKISDPSQSRGNSVTAREVLDKGATEVDSGLANDPVLQARLLYVMARTYEGLGLYPRAEALLARSLEIRHRVLGPDNPDTLTTMTDLAAAIRWQGRLPEAEKLLREAVDRRQRLLGPDNPATLSSMNTLGLVLTDESRYAEAEKLLRQVFEADRRTLGLSDGATLNAENSLAVALEDQNRFPEAEKLYRESADGFKSRFGPEYPNALRGYANLANTLDEEGRYAESEKMQRDVIDIKNRVLGPEHQFTLISKASLADTLTHEGRYAEAEALYRTTIDAEDRAFGPEHPRTLDSMGTFADALTADHRYLEAENLRQEIVQIFTRKQGPEGAETLDAMERLGIIFAYENQYAKAESLFHQALSAAGDSREKSHLAHAWYNFACAAAIARHGDQAFEYLQKASALGAGEMAGMANDNDLKSLRTDPRFTAMIDQTKTRLAASANN